MLMGTGAHGVHDLAAQWLASLSIQSERWHLHTTMLGAYECLALILAAGKFGRYNGDH